MDQSKFFPAKISAPRLPAIFERTRLLVELDEARKAPLVWIAGPPGSGKTTLAASYLNRRNCTALWFRVDQSDADIASFFHYMSLAARGVCSPDYKEPPVFGPAYAQGLMTFSRRYFEQLFGTLAQPFVLVLDDYQQVTEGSPFEQVLLRAIDALPSNGNILVLSREAPPGAFGRLQANRNLETIDWSQLKLDSEEVVSIARSRGITEISAEDLKRLETRSQGWVAGIVLLLREARKEPTSGLDLPAHSPSTLFDYFAREIFETLDRRTRHILMHVAVLPLTTGAMAKNLTGDDLAEKVLMTLHRKNYFTECHGDSETTYELHPLFRDFLLDRLNQIHSGEQLRDINRRAAALLENAEQTEAAINHYQVAEDWDSAARLICDQAESVEKQGRFRTLRSWIMNLPEIYLDKLPWLSYWLGYSERFTSPSEAREHFAIAFAKFEKSGDLQGMYLAWCGVITTTLIAWGDFRSLDKWISKAERLMAENPDFPSVAIEARVISNMCFALIFRRPDCPELPEYAERTLRFLHSSRSPNFQLMGSNLLTLYYAWIGDIAKGRFLLDGIPRYGDDPSIPDPCRIMWLASRAYFSLASGDAGSALETARLGMALSRRSGFRIFDNRLISASIHAHLQIRDCTAARQALLVQRDTLPTGSNLLSFHHHWLSAWAEWVSGNISDAFEYLSSANQILDTIGSPPIPNAKNHIAMAIVCIDAGHREPALQHLAEARQIADATHSLWLEYHCLLIEAGWAFADCRKYEGVEALRAGFRIGRETGIMITDWWDPARISHLCAQAIEHGIEIDYARAVIRKNQLKPDTLGQDLTDWPWSVRISCLGDFILDCDGNPIDMTSKGKKRVMQLLKALIAFGGQGVSTARLTDALWPDADADTAYNTLKTTIHRLRAQLGYPEAVLMHDGSLSLNRTYCWSDTWAFERLAKNGLEEFAEITQIEKAIGLYRGAFLAADDSVSWAIAPRERLRSLFIRASEKLGRHWELLEEWEKAIDTYERGLEIDLLAESFYLRLMKCREKIGTVGEALATYQRCYATFDAELGITPSQKLRSLAMDMQRGI